VFEEVAGLPAHPLLVHAPVVLVPLFALTATAYALLAVVRPHVRWVLGLLAVATPIAALLAKLSGDAFFERLDAAGRITEGFYPVIEEHQQIGNYTLYSSIALGVLTLALVYFVPPGPAGRLAASQVRSTRALMVGLRVLAIAAAAVALYYVIRSGDTGARAVWSGY
jgi:hypothetical protein